MMAADDEICHHVVILVKMRFKLGSRLAGRKNGFTDRAFGIVREKGIFINEAKKNIFRGVLLSRPGVK